VSEIAILRQLATGRRIGSGVTSRESRTAHGFLGLRVGKSSLAMNPRPAIGVLIWFAIILATASIASAGWKEEVLYSFQGGTDGSTPAGGVVFDSAGDLYGATQQGGGSGCKPTGYCGTVFQLKPPARQGDPWTETLLHVFAGITDTGRDGADPAGGLVIDAAGNLYGTTAYGGSGDCFLAGIKGGCGTVYELEPPKTKGGGWTYKILYNFQGGKDGDFAWGDLAFDHAGNLYGATQFGGGFGSCDSPFYQFCGTVFELSPPQTKGSKWTEKVLYSFKGGKDGANPNGGLLLDRMGAIYGTTFAGGGGSQLCNGTEFVGCGTVFELIPGITKSAAWKEKLLHQFSGYPKDGARTNGGPVFGSNGDLYGTTVGGGSAEEGEVFRLGAMGSDHWRETILHIFKGGNDEAVPMGGVVFNSSGNLFGTACLGGPLGGGALYELRQPQ
jgi:uncharacterized repeat protein (TIGR03803 family)